MTPLTADVQAARDPATRSAPGPHARRSDVPAPGILAVRAGWALTGFAALFLLFDTVIKLMLAPEAVAGTAELGWPSSVVQGLGLLELCCLAIYLIPRTAVLGAVLWTGYLGGAVATHLRVGNPLLSHTLFPIYVAALVWGGLWLRDRRVRALLSR